MLESVTDAGINHGKARNDDTIVRIPIRELHVEPDNIRQLISQAQHNKDPDISVTDQAEPDKPPIISLQAPLALIKQAQEVHLHHATRAPLTAYNSEPCTQAANPLHLTTVNQYPTTNHTHQSILHLP